MGTIWRFLERDRRPTVDELETLFAAFAANTRNKMPMSETTKFAIATAMRLDEIVQIEWRHLDPCSLTILVEDRKELRPRTLHALLTTQPPYSACAFTMSI
jgi:integrase